MDHRFKVYLAGPEVFLPRPQADEIGEAKRAICAELGLEALHPLDNAPDPRLEGAARARAIYEGNRRLLDAAQLLIANLTPFRGPSADAGTAFELGYAAARSIPVFAYSEAGDSYLERMRRIGLAEAGDTRSDRLGMAIEDFGLADNLMLVCAVQASGAEIVTPGAGRVSEGASVFAELSTFRACARRAADAIAARTG